MSPGGLNWGLIYLLSFAAFICLVMAIHALAGMLIGALVGLLLGTMLWMAWGAALGAIIGVPTAVVLLHMAWRPPSEA